VGRQGGGAIVDMGTPLEAVTRLGPGSAAERAAQITGFSVLQAETAGELTRLLDGHPHLHMADGSIDVLEFLPMPSS
jgi:hypothetical protein